MTSNRAVSVLHVLESLDDRRGGLQTAVILIANAQARAGHHVSILSALDPVRGRSENLTTLDSRVEVEVFPFSRLTRRFFGSRGLRRRLSSAVGAADVVHTHGIWALPPFLAARSAIRRGRRLLVSPHGSLTPWDVEQNAAAAKHVLGPLFIRPLLEGADRVVCTTERESTDLVTFGASPARTIVPIPPTRQESSGRSRREIRDFYGIRDDETVLLFLARIDFKKGLHLLVESLALLPPELPVRLMVVGGGGPPDYEERVRRLIEEKGVGDRVLWVGWLNGPDKSDAYRAADLFVLMSYMENYGITVFEATQAGLPVLLTRDVYASPELLMCGAARATSRDVRQASEAIRELVTDKNALADMARSARAFSEEHLADGRIQEQYSNLLIGDR